MNEVFDASSHQAVFSRLGWCTSNTKQLGNFREWQDFVHDNFPWLEHRNNTSGQFEAEVSTHHFGNDEVNAIDLSTISASDGEVIRTRHLAEVADAGFIKIIWQLNGKIHLEQNSKSCLILPGQAAVCDTARPYKIGMTDSSRFAVLTLPHQACVGWDYISEFICGTRLQNGASINAALGSLMALAAADQDSVTSEDVLTVIQAIQLMTTKALHRSAAVQGVSKFDNPRLYKVQRFILENISNSNFSTDDLASSMCMSRRSLYMLFEGSSTTPARLIRDTRLELAMHMLADNGQNHRKITDIVFDIGFNDYATFSRIFKTQYGKTPSEFRSTSLSLSRDCVH
ncbi:helix-turn-helix domain-containing protein [Zhongshania sp. BJYM1]|uniref:helix-turn-helix domain-containing protein n=1 Tax=Zhongshania aquatica TaxID=2965069 RepID=UPI0022B330D8|nr:helix-turn-helix domain-containing protein [Marortus sp. BJYM1]